MRKLLKNIIKIPINIMVLIIDITLIICMLAGIENKIVAKWICMSISVVAIVLSICLIKILGEL